MAVVTELDRILDQTGAVAHGVASSLPAGTVTFLLTDVEGSTRLWEARPEEMGPAISAHYAILDEAVAAANGVRPVEQGEGDSVVAAFTTAGEAVRAAVEAARRLTAELAWLPVRMAIHTGPAERRDEGNYVGRTIIRTARLRACAHGGQIVLSDVATSLVRDDLPPGAALVELGTVRLRGMARTERVWQLVHPDLRRDFPALRSVETAPSNLPAPPTALVGRQAEQAEVLALLQAGRLVTLTGAGGCGKTRLALQVGADLVDAHTGGVWWVELAPVSAGAQVADVVAATLGLPPGAAADVVTSVVDHLRSAGAALLVIDNAEHVIDATARMLDTVVRSCPGVRALVTSREPLGVPGEAIYRVPSLSLPPDGTPVALDQLVTYDAPRLFLERARQARPNLAVDSASVRHVVDICARLDGLPLALELAAARARTLPLDRLARGLDDAFRLLTGGARTALARQQTLLASVWWSYDLLDDTERAVLRRLAVLPGLVRARCRRSRRRGRHRRRRVHGPRGPGAPRRQEPRPVRRHQRPVPGARDDPPVRLRSPA